MEFPTEMRVRTKTKIKLRNDRIWQKLKMLVIWVNNVCYCAVDLYVIYFCITTACTNEWDSVSFII